MVIWDFALFVFSGSNQKEDPLNNELYTYDDAGKLQAWKSAAARERIQIWILNKLSWNIFCI